MTFSIAKDKVYMKTKVTHGKTPARFPANPEYRPFKIICPPPRATWYMMEWDIKSKYNVIGKKKKNPPDRCKHRCSRIKSLHLIY